MCFFWNAINYGLISEKTLCSQATPAMSVHNSFDACSMPTKAWKIEVQWSEQNRYSNINLISDNLYYKGATLK